jgi:hypothetical protein
VTGELRPLDTPSAEQIAEWRRLADAATPGPWRALTDDHGYKGIEHALWSGELNAMGSYVAEFMVTRADADFAAAAREAVPALIAALEAAHTQLAELRIEYGVTLNEWYKTAGSLAMAEAMCRDRETVSQRLVGPWLPVAVSGTEGEPT